MDMEFFLPICAYFFGSIPFGLLIGRMAGVDIRQGSGNIGATNVGRLLGRGLGLLTLLGDCLKGLLPMPIAAATGRWQWVDRRPDRGGVMAVLGHIFPIYLGFRGGKGVATGLGVFLYLSPPAALFGLIVFMVTVLISGFVSLASLCASASIVVWLYLLDAPWVTILTASVVAALIWIRHYQNIFRLWRGQEPGWRKADRGGSLPRRQ